MSSTQGTSADGRLLFATCFVRNLGYGFVSVILGLYLVGLGFDVAVIGGVFTAALAGGAALTLLLTTVADRAGRRRVLQIGAALMAASGAAYAMSDNVVVLIVAGILGSISPSGKDVGPFLSLEQAMLPQTAADARRTELFATYNIVNYAATAAGALIAAVPGIVGLPVQDGFRYLLWGYALLAVVLLLLFSRLSRAVESPTHRDGAASTRIGLGRSRGTVMKLGGLFALDSFAGGFIVQSLMALWLNLRFGADAGILGAIFFGTNFLAAVSFLAAPRLARRFGLLNTMVFSHLPSNVLLLCVPLMPNLQLATALLLLRFLLSQMDVPTRQSYTMAIVDPQERAAASGVLAVSRNAAAAAAPAFAGATLAVPALGLPFLLAGGLKIVYDLAIYQVFREVRPPEEASRSSSQRLRSSPPP